MGWIRIRNFSKVGSGTGINSPDPQYYYKPVLPYRDLTDLLAVNPDPGFFWPKIEKRKCSHGSLLPSGSRSKTLQYFRVNCAIHPYFLSQPKRNQYLLKWRADTSKLELTIVTYLVDQPEPGQGGGEPQDTQQGSRRGERLDLLVVAVPKIKNHFKTAKS